MAFFSYYSYERFEKCEKVVQVKESVKGLREAAEFLIQLHGENNPAFS